MTAYPYSVKFIIPLEPQTYPSPVIFGSFLHVSNLTDVWDQLLRDNHLEQYVEAFENYEFRNIEPWSLGGTKLFVDLSEELGSRMINLGGVARLGDSMIFIDVEAVSRT